MSTDFAPVVLRVGMDGAVTRVPFVADERGAGALLREQIGCSLFDVIALDRRTDMWVDDESIVGVDLSDRAALAAVTNVVATIIAQSFGRQQLVFGSVVITGLAGASTALLRVDQLERVEQIAGEAVAAFGDVLAAHVGGGQ